MRACVHTNLRVTALAETVHDVDVRQHVEHVRQEDAPHQLLQHVARCLADERVAGDCAAEVQGTAQRLRRLRPRWRASDTETVALADGMQLQVDAEAAAGGVVLTAGRVALRAGDAWVATEMQGLLVEDTSDAGVVTAYAYACPDAPGSRDAACFYKHGVVSDGATTSRLRSPGVFVPTHMPLHKHSVAHFEVRQMCALQHQLDTDAHSLGAHAADRAPPAVERLPHGIVAVATRLPPYTMTTFFVPCHV
jgi:hypothetical protein